MTCQDCCDKVLDKSAINAHCVTLMEFSLRQCTEKVSEKSAKKSLDFVAKSA